MQSRATTTLLASLMCLGAPVFAAAGERTEPPSIIVQGEGKVYAKPSLASVQIGVVSQAATAAQALADNSKEMTELVKTVTAQGVADKDVQTSAFDIAPNYINSTNRSPKISGYTVRNNVTVKIRNTDKVGSLLDAVVYSGANQVNSIVFSVDERSRLLDEARKEAIEDARRKAALYAEAAGVQLGKVLYVVEGGASPRPMFYAPAAAMMAGGLATTPIAAGEQQLSVSATVVFAIQ